MADSTSESRRLSQLLKQRQVQEEILAEKRLQILKQSRNSLGSISQKFSGGNPNIVSQTQASTNVGVQRQENKPKVKLSFDSEDEHESETSISESESGVSKRFKKDPSTDTSFLPDAARSQEEAILRTHLQQKWLEEQFRLKEETVPITFSYWDGTGHRKTILVKKGDSIAQFLEKARREFKTLSGVPVDSLMFVKEDLIVPHHYTFYDFIVNKVRGKSGPLFEFDVRDDVRLVNDANREREETHAGKVVERRWYERNKHIFPASRWEVYEPEKNYGSYTIKDSQKGQC